MRILVKTTFIIGLILLFGNIVFAAPAAPSPTCKINAEISEVTFHEAYFQEDNGLPCNAGGRNIPAKYLLKVKVNDVSSVREDGPISCTELYPPNSEKTLTIYENSVKVGDSFQKNQLIKGEIHFGGDECGSGIYLNNYEIVNGEPQEDSNPNQLNEEKEITTDESSNFFSRIWSWIKSLFG